MLERQEIDALLISALYGELTPAEETRLEAHLGSHPADKTALAALTSTREAVRASRILQVQLDPPQSVSALLMQEAARRAPKRAEQEGWFARLARSFMAHPAMAAAAMLVVVIGLATLVQNRKGDHFADSSAPAQSMEAKPSASDQSIVASPGKDRADDDGDGVARPAGEAAGSSAGSGAAFGGDANDNFTVSLADSEGRKQEAQKQQVTDTKIAGGERKRLDTAKADQGGLADETAARQESDKGKITTKAKQSGAYMELRSPEPTVKELEGNSNGEVAQGTYAPPPAEEYSRESVNAITPGPGLARGGGATAAPSTVQPQPPRANTANATPPASKPTTKGGPAKAAPPDSQVARNVDSSSKNAPAPPPPPAAPAKVATAPGTGSSTGAKTAAPAQDKSGNDSQLAWAREQHTAIIARVRDGDCKGAAAIAVGLANRDLAYYKQNVASDRSVKECLAYIDNAREKDQEQRAERSKAPKRTMNEPAAAPAKKEPAKATTTDAAH